jgi:hypothetical protein
MAEALKGTTTAARLLHMKECPDLLAVCVYDSKPVHLLSMVAESVEWNVKKRKVFHREMNAMKEMGYLWLNVIDDYNLNMNAVDVADQLCGIYRPDHWMRHKKWWWSIFMWGLGVAQVNAYKIYQYMWDEEKVKGKGDLPEKWSHDKFIKQLVYDLIFPEQTVVHREALLREEEDDLSVSRRSLSSFGGSSLQEEEEREWDFSCNRGINKFLTRDKGRRITKEKMNGSHFLRHFDGHFHAMVKAFPTSLCQYCYFAWNHEYDKKQKKSWSFMEKNRKDIIHCVVCNVNLCPKCVNEWHRVDMRDTNKVLEY